MISKKIDPEDYFISCDLNPNNKSYIYGEINPHCLLHTLQTLFDTDSTLEFLDIGSGCGRTLEYLHQHLPYMLHGIEIDINRYEKAIALFEYMDMYDRIDCTNGDFREMYFGTYDIIYCCNCVFEDQENNALYSKLLGEFKGTALLFEYNHILLPFLTNTYTVNTSWHNSVPLYIFNFSKN